MRVQLWSYNYDPEPTGIGPVSRLCAEGLRDHGHVVSVIAAHPHYPEPSWGKSRWAYREERNGIPLLRLPLWVGRATTLQRYRQELTFMLAQSAALPLAGHADVVVSVSPCFPALLPAMTHVRLRRLPWVLWLQDILPDGATATDLTDDGFVLQMARRLERAAYRNADKIIVPARSFAANLRGRGVPGSKVSVIYNPATRPTAAPPHSISSERSVRVLCMGNIGHSQGLAQLVRAFERDSSMAELSVRLVITGTGVAADEVRAEVVSDRVELLGVVDQRRLDRELEDSTVGLVSQRHSTIEFNVPSKLMNFMAAGRPVIAIVNPRSETARIIEESGAGWIVDSREPKWFSRRLAEIVATPSDIQSRGLAAYDYAQTHFLASHFVTRFDAVLHQTVGRSYLALAH